MLNENHGAEPVARDNDYGCHAGCFAPVAPANRMSDLKRWSKMKITLSSKYYLGELYSNGAWSRLTLYHYRQNSQGGSMSTPVAEVDIVDHPSRDGCNAHREIKISLRNDLKKIGDEVCIDGNKVALRQPKDIIDISILDAVPSLLVREKLALEPISIYICVRHIDSFKVEGDFWSDE